MVLAITLRLVLTTFLVFPQNAQRAVLGPSFSYILSGVATRAAELAPPHHRVMSKLNAPGSAPDPVNVEHVARANLSLEDDLSEVSGRWTLGEGTHWSGKVITESTRVGSVLTFPVHRMTSVLLFCNSDTQPVPPFYLPILRTFLTEQPGDTNFLVELNPGSGFGTVTCMEDQCWSDTVLSPDPSAPGGGRDRGLGSLYEYTLHCAGEEHIKCRDKRLAKMVSLLRSF